MPGATLWLAWQLVGGAAQRHGAWFTGRNWQGSRVTSPLASRRRSRPIKVSRGMPSRYPGR